MVGVVAAQALLQAGFQVTLIESQAPVLDPDNLAATARVSALNQSSITLLKASQVWQALNNDCLSPLAAMHVWANDGVIDFEAEELQAETLGYIVENREIIRASWNLINSHENFTCYCPATPVAIKEGEFEVKVTCKDGRVVAAPLLIAADGGHSWVRQQLGITCKERPYYQSAIVAVVQTDKPHHGVALQHFMPTGPLGILPLSDQNSMAIVWSSNEAERLMALKDNQFNFELTNALDNKLGMIVLKSQRMSIPLIMRHANHYVKPRIALVGDAAHTIHPLAGQGVNLGFADVVELVEQLTNASTSGDDIGSFKLLRRYERARKTDNEAMLLLMRGFCELMSDDATFLSPIMNGVMNWINRTHFLKQFFMRYVEK